MTFVDDIDLKDKGGLTVIAYCHLINREGGVLLNLTTVIENIPWARCAVLALI